MAMEEADALAAVLTNFDRWAVSQPQPAPGAAAAAFLPCLSFFVLLSAAPLPVSSGLVHVVCTALLPFHTASQ